MTAGDRRFLLVERYAIGVLVALAFAALAGCDTSPAASGSTPGSAATTSAATPSAAPPSGSSGSGSGDWCALAERIAVQSGIMVNKHFVSPQQETRDMLKAVISLSLANRDALLVGLPGDVRAALVVELQYYQALQDSNFASPPPADWKAAHAIVVKYEVEKCGFVYDK
jgi:hypothetical protein